MFKTLVLSLLTMASPLGDAITAVEQASDMARREGRCERAIGHELARTLRQLRAARESGVSVELVSEVRSLARGASTTCPKAIASSLARAVEVLEDY